MKLVAWGIVNFDAMLLIMIFVSAGMMYRGKYLASSRIHYFITAVFFLIVVTPFPRLYVSHLESLYPQITEVPSDISGALIVGGMVDREITLDRNQPAFNFNGGRMTHIVRFMHAHPKLTYFIMAGGSPYMEGYQEGDILKKHFIHMHKEGIDIQYDTSASTTSVSAKNSLTHLNPGKKRWLLITSAYHMARAMRDFENAGWNVVACPTDYKTKKSESYSFNFSIFKGILYWKIAMHEFLMHIIEGIDTNPKQEYIDPN